MLKSDAIDLFDLSEAGRLLFRDPARLAREARLRQIPATRVDGALAFPVAWVEAAAGKAAVDPEALRSYWLERLAPPSPDARRATRERDRLPVASLLTGPEAARRIFADPAALRRLDMDGTLPSIRVDGVPHYDELLTDLVAAGHEEGAETAREARANLVRGWARFEYQTVASGPTSAEAPAATTPRFDEPAPSTGSTDEPRAFEIPADLELDRIAPELPPSRLIEADGFDVVDED